MDAVAQFVKMLTLGWCFMTAVQRIGHSCSLVIVLMCAASIPTWGQTGTLQDQLNSIYKGKVLLLRSFYAGTDLEYDKNGILLSRASSGPWTLARVEITDVMVATQGIEVVGNRLGQNDKPRLTKEIGNLIKRVWLGPD
jgi:hypothetical protein